MISIPKANEDWSNYPCWQPTGTTDGRKLKPIIICKCGHPFGLGRHSINDRGEINASFFHRDKDKEGDNLGCGFHEHLKCEGWDGGSFSISEGNR